MTEPVALTRENFASYLANAKTPVLVDFWASWCGPCRMIAPYVEKIAKEYDGRIAVAKVNIDEELTRLKSHIHQFRDIIGQAGSGKKADFLMQEFNREANTVCSKSNDIEITRLALSLKNEIEKVREQVQNLE